MNCNIKLLAGLAVLASATLASAQNIHVVVDGERVRFRGQPPVEVDDRVLVPLRGVFEQMGAQVDWNPDTQTVVATRGDTRVKLTIGQRSASVNGEAVRLDVPALIIRDSTMVPLRFVGEALGERVHWDEYSQTVSIVAGDFEFARDHQDQQVSRTRDVEVYSAPPAREPVVEREYVEPAPPPRVIVPERETQDTTIVYTTDTVLPLEIDPSFEMERSRPGERIEATVRPYPGLPEGCRVEGVIRDVDNSFRGEPPLIEFRFDTMITPSGHRYHIDGQSVALGSRTIYRTGDGYIRSRGPVAAHHYVRIGAANEVGCRLVQPIRIEERVVTERRPSYRRGEY